MNILSLSAFTAELFVLAVGELLATLTQPTVLVLDNASIHRPHLVKAQVAAWAAQGLTLLFLPPYSPELNRIEILWRFCKHYWLPPEAYQPPPRCCSRWWPCYEPLEHQTTKLLLPDYLEAIQVDFWVPPKRQLYQTILAQAK